MGLHDRRQNAKKEMRRDLERKQNRLRMQRVRAAQKAAGITEQRKDFR